MKSTNIIEKHGLTKKAKKEEHVENFNFKVKLINALTPTSTRAHYDKFTFFFLLISSAWIESLKGKLFGSFVGCPSQRTAWVVRHVCLKVWK